MNNEDINAEYSKIIETVFGNNEKYKQISEQTESEIIPFIFSNKDSTNEYINAIQKEYLHGISVIQQNDMIIISSHGKGPNITHKNLKFDPKRIVQELENQGVFSKEINNIYTLSCEGGKQTEFLTKQGRKVRSIHSSLDLIKYSSDLDNNIVFTGNTKNKKFTNDPFIIEDYKKSIIENYKKKGKDAFTTTHVILPSEVDNILFPVDKLNYEYQIKNGVDKKQPDLFKNIKSSLDEQASKYKEPEIKNIKSTLNPEPNKFKLTNKQIGIVAGASIAALSTIGLVAIHNKKQKEENKLKKEQYKNRQYNYEPQEFDTNYSKEVAKTISSFNNRSHL